MMTVTLHAEDSRYLHFNGPEGPLITSRATTKIPVSRTKVVVKLSESSDIWCSVCGGWVEPQALGQHVSARKHTLPLCTFREMYGMGQTAQATNGMANQQALTPPMPRTEDRPVAMSPTPVSVSPPDPNTHHRPAISQTPTQADPGASQQNWNHGRLPHSQMTFNTDEPDMPTPRSDQDKAFRSRFINRLNLKCPRDRSHHTPNGQDKDIAPKILGKRAGEPLENPAANVMCKESGLEKATQDPVPESSKATWTLNLDEYKIILQGKNTATHFDLKAFVKYGGAKKDHRFPLQLQREDSEGMAKS